jgi:hypothetical protein
MKTRIYLRIGNTNGKIKVVANIKPDLSPLKNGTGRYSRSIPTVYMSLELIIPDEAFKPPNISASIAVPIEKLGVAIETVDPLNLIGGNAQDIPAQSEQEQEGERG